MTGAEHEARKLLDMIEDTLAIVRGTLEGLERAEAALLAARDRIDALSQEAGE
jgi:hypothetical protein